MMADVKDDMNSLPGPRSVRVRPSSPSRAASKESRRALEQTVRGEKPTGETSRKGEYARIAGEKLDVSLKGETLLVNMKARAGGAAAMFSRGQISAREMKAAERLCLDFELSQRSQLSGLPMGERVDGGSVDTSGNRVRAAAMAFERYREALETLTQAGRVLVENVVVGRMPMEEAVRLRTVAHRMGNVKHLDNQRNRAFLIVSEALEMLADHYGLAKG